MNLSAPVINPHDTVVMHLPIPVWSCIFHYCLLLFYFFKLNFEVQGWGEAKERETESIGLIRGRKSSSLQVVTNFQQGEFDCWGKSHLIKASSALCQDPPCRRYKRSNFKFSSSPGISSVQDEGNLPARGVPWTDSCDTGFCMQPLLSLNDPFCFTEDEKKCCTEKLPVAACVHARAFAPTCSYLPRGSWGSDFGQSRGDHGLSHTEEKRQWREEGNGCAKSNWLLRTTVWTNRRESQGCQGKGQGHTRAAQPQE